MLHLESAHCYVQCLGFMLWHHAVHCAGYCLDAWRSFIASNDSFCEMTLPGVHAGVQSALALAAMASRGHRKKR